MKIQTSIVALACLLFQYSCTSQVPSPNIILSVPTLEQEATSVWRTINDIAFLEEQGYQINLPRHDTIQFLVDKSRNKNFGNTDFGTIYNLLESGIYEKGNYEKAFSKVNAQLELINSLVQRLTVIKESWNWNFKIFDSYDIVFTIYGTGGSYDPDNGRVTLFTNEEGQFMKYDNPANTIIHEIVHMGIEESIVQKYNLSHGLKERIVDRITYLLFKESLPNYRIQEMGDDGVDGYIKDKLDLKDLSRIIEKYLKARK